MSKPVLEYYWVKVLEDGVTSIPQFDPETGKENRWYGDTSPISKVLYVPFTVDLADKVITNGTPAMSTLNPVVEFIVDPSEATFVEAGRDNEITVFDYFVCDVCGWKFQFTKEDGRPFPKCPQCGSEDDWFCSRCNEYKYEYRITEKNQVQCLDCDIPVGLDRTRKMFRMQQENHVCDYFIRTPTRNLTIYNSGNISVK
jgi:predicted RNA-binding Zn-ribbon protein involved in translation (DUF1610 family)